MNNNKDNNNQGYNNFNYQPELNNKNNKNNKDDKKKIIILVSVVLVIAIIVTFVALKPKKDKIGKNEDYVTQYDKPGDNEVEISDRERFMGENEIEANYGNENNEKGTDDESQGSRTKLGTMYATVGTVPQEGKFDNYIQMGYKLDKYEIVAPSLSSQTLYPQKVMNQEYTELYGFLGYRDGSVWKRVETIEPITEIEYKYKQFGGYWTKNDLEASKIEGQKHLDEVKSFKYVDPYQENKVEYEALIKEGKIYEAQKLIEDKVKADINKYAKPYYHNIRAIQPDRTVKSTNVEQIDKLLSEGRAELINEKGKERELVLLYTEETTKELNKKSQEGVQRALKSYAFDTVHSIGFNLDGSGKVKSIKIDNYEYYPGEIQGELYADRGMQDKVLDTNDLK